MSYVLCLMSYIGKYSLFWFTFEKKFFRFFGLFCAHSASKFAKNANLTQIIIFSNYFDMGIKNAEFDADFESVEKVVKNAYKKVICIKV